MDKAANARITAYINDVCSQIKLREVHQEIRLELNAHLQEIIEEYLSQGCLEAEAVSKAVAQMGSAEVVGKELNKIHRPKPEWSILAIALLFAGIGLLSLYFIESQGLLAAYSISIFTRGIVFTLIGAALAAGLYLFDYRKLQSYSRHIYLFSLLLLLLLLTTGPQVGGKLYLKLGPLSFDIAQIIPLLFCIALAGILHKWDWSKPKGLLLGLLLGVVPLLAILASCPLPTGVIYAVACTVIMIASGAGKARGLLLISLFTCIITLPFISSPYRLSRLLTFINPESDAMGSGWLSIQLSNLINSSGLFGQGIAAGPSALPEPHTDFIFSYITFTFGWVAGIVLAALVVLFIVRITRIADLVKNSYARLLISGFAAIFAVQFLWNISMNLGFAPIISVGLPFISFGGSQLIFNAAALGVISSIYRRRTVAKALING